MKPLTAVKAYPSRGVQASKETQVLFDLPATTYICVLSEAICTLVHFKLPRVRMQRLGETSHPPGIDRRGKCRGQVARM